MFKESILDSQCGEKYISFSDNCLLNELNEERIPFFKNKENNEFFYKLRNEDPEQVSIL